MLHKSVRQEVRTEFLERKGRDGNSMYILLELISNGEEERVCYTHNVAHYAQCEIDVCRISNANARCPRKRGASRNLGETPHTTSPRNLPECLRETIRKSRLVAFNLLGLYLSSGKSMRYLRYVHNNSVWLTCESMSYIMIINILFWHTLWSLHSLVPPARQAAFKKETLVSENAD